ncbi:MAG: rRNA maturation RNase YbeY [Myxococcota bacterium]|jgi:probable rRNA maturation factor|nr:rRNA maturation RNase YbeY [Myxococcota bacterium]
MNVEPERAQVLLCELESPLPLETLEQRLYALFDRLELANAEVCLSLVDDAQIRELNRDYRGVDEATDVLAFAMREGEGPFFAHDPLGDVVISVECAQRMVESQDHRQRVAEELQRPELQWTLLEELTFLMIHGILHLLGMDHAEPQEEQQMRAREAALFLAMHESERNGEPTTV